MTRLTRLVASGSVLAAFSLSTPGVDAHQLAVPGSSPANPIAVLSVPDAAQTWGKIGRTPLGAALNTMFTSSPATADPMMEAWLEQVNTAGQELGFALAPAELFGSTVRGFDLYAIGGAPANSLVAVVAFNDASAPNRILDQVKREVRQASGTSGGFAADTIEERTVGQRRIVDLPAFSLHFASSGNTLTISTDAAALTSSFSDQGRVAFTSEFFRRYNAGLGDTGADMWFFGEPGALLPLVLRGLLNPDVITPDAEVQKVSIARISILPDAIKTTTFLPAEDMELARQRFTRAAPPAGPLNMLDQFPGSGIFHYATNYFDGLAVLDHLLDMMTGVPGSTVEKDQVEAQLAGSTALFGFDVQNDLLANLGPDAGFVVTEFKTDAGLPIWAVLEAALIVGIRDLDRFNEVLQIFEESATAPARGDRPAVSFIKDAEAHGLAYKYLEVPLLANLGFIPSYLVTEQGKFLIATDRAGLEALLGVRTGNTPSYSASSTFRSINSKLTSNRNAQTQLNLPEVMALLLQNQGLAGQIDVNSPVTRGVLEVLQSLKTFTSVTIHGSNGRRVEHLIHM